MGGEGNGLDLSVRYDPIRLARIGEPRWRASDRPPKKISTSSASCGSVDKIKKPTSTEIMAKQTDLLHHPHKADGVMLHHTAAFPAHHLVHRSRRAGWGVFASLSLKFTPLGGEGEGEKGQGKRCL